MAHSMTEGVQYRTSSCENLSVHLIGVWQLSWPSAWALLKRTGSSWSVQNFLVLKFVETGTETVDKDFSEISILLVATKKSKDSEEKESYIKRGRKKLPPSAINPLFIPRNRGTIHSHVMRIWHKKTSLSPFLHPAETFSSSLVLNFWFERIEN